MKNIEAYELYTMLTVGLKDCKVGFPVEINSARRKNIRILAPIAEDYIELKNELIKKYGNTDADGKCSVEVSNKEFLEEFKKLNDIENDITLHTFPEELIPNGLTAQEYDCVVAMVQDSANS